MADEIKATTGNATPDTAAAQENAPVLEQRSTAERRFEALSSTEIYRRQAKEKRLRSIENARIRAEKKQGTYSDLDKEAREKQAQEFLAKEQAQFDERKEDSDALLERISEEDAALKEATAKAEEQARQQALENARLAEAKARERAAEIEAQARERAAAIRESAAISAPLTTPLMMQTDIDTGTDVLLNGVPLACAADGQEDDGLIFLDENGKPIGEQPSSPEEEGVCVTVSVDDPFAPDNQPVAKEDTAVAQDEDTVADAHTDAPACCCDICDDADTEQTPAPVPEVREVLYDYPIPALNARNCADIIKRVGSAVRVTESAGTKADKKNKRLVAPADIALALLTRRNEAAAVINAEIKLQCAIARATDLPRQVQDNANGRKAVLQAALARFDDLTNRYNEQFAAQTPLTSLPQGMDEIRADAPVHFAPMADFCAQDMRALAEWKTLPLSPDAQPVDLDAALRECSADIQQASAEREALYKELAHLPSYARTAAYVRVCAAEKKLLDRAVDTLQLLWKAGDLEAFAFYKNQYEKEVITYNALLRHAAASAKLSCQESADPHIPSKIRAGVCFPAIPAFGVTLAPAAVAPTEEELNAQRQAACAAREQAQKEAVAQSDKEAAAKELAEYLDTLLALRDAQARDISRLIDLFLFDSRYGRMEELHNDIRQLRDTISEYNRTTALANRTGTANYAYMPSDLTDALGADSAAQDAVTVEESQIPEQEEVRFANLKEYRRYIREQTAIARTHENARDDLLKARTQNATDKMERVFEARNEEVEAIGAYVACYRAAVAMRQQADERKFRTQVHRGLETYDRLTARANKLCRANKSSFGPFKTAPETFEELMVSGGEIPALQIIELHKGTASPLAENAEAEKRKEKDSAAIAAYERDRQRREERAKEKAQKAALTKSEKEQQEYLKRKQFAIDDYRSELKDLQKSEKQGGTQVLYKELAAQKKIVDLYLQMLTDTQHNESKKGTK